MISCIDPQNSRGVIGRHRIAPIGVLECEIPHRECGQLSCWRSAWKDCVGFSGVAGLIEGL